MSEKVSKLLPLARRTKAESAAPPLPENSPETHFLRAWFEYDSGFGNPEQRRKWGTLLGLVMVLGISGGFWTGIGLLIARLLK
ncbi:MAG TPA: hypothetical protein VKV39_17735 [Candidatus Sulfotelmatobacter sp.]|nr:hypothetical protein [Candidatus Sulfotelmatobacter sp.]